MGLDLPSETSKLLLYTNVIWSFDVCFFFWIKKIIVFKLPLKSMVQRNDVFAFRLKLYGHSSWSLSLSPSFLVVPLPYSWLCRMWATASLVYYTSGLAMCHHDEKNRRYGWGVKAPICRNSTIYGLNYINCWMVKWAFRFIVNSWPKKNVNKILYLHISFF